MNRNVGRKARRTYQVRSMSVALTLLLGGCASFSPDQGMAPIEAAATEALGKNVVKIRNADDARDVKARVAALLAGSLTADAAVQIALLNNRALQAAFNDLGVSEAQMVEATLPPSGFIDHYLTGVVYPQQHETLIQLGVAVAVAISWVGYTWRARTLRTDEVR